MKGRQAVSGQHVDKERSTAVLYIETQRQTKLYMEFDLPLNEEMQIQTKWRNDVRSPVRKS